jgi:small subunit ribosomal protein S18
VGRAVARVPSPARSPGTIHEEEAVARDREPRAPKKKFCKLCLEKVPHVDYKDDKRLTRFVTDRGKIVPRRISGTCARHQKQVTLAVKRARVLALLPFSSDFYR